MARSKKGSRRILQRQARVAVPVDRETGPGLVRAKAGTRILRQRRRQLVSLAQPRSHRCRPVDLAEFSFSSGVPLALPTSGASNLN